MVKMSNKSQGRVQKDKLNIDVTEPQGMVDKIFNDVNRHYEDAQNDTRQRIVRQDGFDDIDKMFRTYINPDNWPYQAIIADPRTFTFIIEKGSRMLANKLRGRLEPREGGDILGAKINNALLDFQWDNDNYGGTQLAKWTMMDQLTRKYGAAFKLEKWRYETRNGKTIFDGPSSKTLPNRDCLPDPSASTLEDCNWFQVRTWPTFQELEAVNDAAQTGPVYKNLDVLREAIDKDSTKSKGGNRRDTYYQSVSRQLLGLTDGVGDDRVFKTVEVVTEYRRDRWITFAPKYRVILRDIENPYGHNEIPITMLRYYAVDDDLYGLSEVEPVMKLFKGINAFLSHGVDEANMKLYTPLKIRANAVRMHTINFDGPTPKWIMNDPTSDVIEHQTSSNNLPQLSNIYSMMVSATQEALGESSLGVSNFPGPTQNNDKTATEVRQVTSQTKGRDNFNQIFLQEAIERQMMLWYSMNQKMLISKKGKQGYIVRVTGKDAIEFFKSQGLDSEGLTEEAALLAQENPDMNPQNMMTPPYPVNEQQFGQPTKFQMDQSGQAGTLVVEPQDLDGNYDYIADVESMALGAADNERAGKQKAVDMILNNPNTLMALQQEGIKPKFKEMLVDTLEDAGFKDADKYFEAIPQQPQSPPGQPMGMPGQSPQMGGLINGSPVNGAGTGTPAPGLPAQGNGIQQGMGTIPSFSGQ